MQSAHLSKQVTSLAGNSAESLARACHHQLCTAKTDLPDVQGFKDHRRLQEEEPSLLAPTVVDTSQFALG